MQVPKSEYAIIAHQTMTYPKKTERNHVFTAINYYLCADITDDGGFTILASLPIVGNEDLIDKLRHERDTRNLISIETLAGLENLIRTIRHRGGRVYRDDSNTKGIRNSRRNGRLGDVALSREAKNGRSERGTDSLREDETRNGRDANDRGREIDSADISIEELQRRLKRQKNQSA